MKSGVVCIVGRPSVGKSTFLNTVCRQQVAIVSALPQTTRNAIRGIVTTETGQIVFIDTPGYHISEKKINKKLQSITENRLQEADVILYLVDSSRAFGEEERALCALLQNRENIVIGINKIDDVDAEPVQTAAHLLQALPAIAQSCIFTLSARTQKGVKPLIEALFALLPEGDLLYPEEFYTDQPVAFRIAEIIREQAIALLYDEIPHALYVRIEDMSFRKNGKELFVRAFLCVERESQKAMVIGKRAALIKQIRLASQVKMRKVFPYWVALDLQVRVDKNWRQKDKVLQAVFDE
ncbi:MAG: GTPase Era [Treponema sp.]